MEAARLGSHLVVHLEKLGSNIEALKKRAADNKILFMVKADGYGHGLVEVVKYAFQNHGIKEFGVASLGEAMTLRRHLPDLPFEIYVFSDLQFFQKELIQHYLDYRLIPVISHEADLELCLENQELKDLPLCLKFNTGMNRLGLSCDRTEEIIGALKKHQRPSVFHLMSHLANASMAMESNNRNVWQRERFSQVKDSFKKHGITVERTSLGNSGALEQGFCLEESHIRPGLMLFGPTSLAPQHKDKGKWQGKIISELKTKIINSFPVKKGDPLGYSSIPAPHDGQVAIISLGYGDGISTRFQGATLYHHGVAGKVCARVCMDMTYVLFPKGTKLSRGEEFIVWGEDSGKFMELAHQTKTLSYELVIALTTRVPRIYHID